VLDKLGTHRMVGHGGSLLGFRSDYLRLPEDKLSVIVLANSAGAPVDAIAAGIAARYVKDLFPGREAIKLSAAQLDALAGSYRFGSGNLTTLTREGSGLRFVSPRIGLDSLLLPTSPTVFFSTDDPRMHVEFKGSGPAARLTSYMNGTEQSSGGREPTQEERMASFAANDRNKDGKLDKTEYHELLKPLGFGDQVDALFQQRDVNKDAFVSAEEYRTPIQ
jgi:EF hand